VTPKRAVPRTDGFADSASSFPAAAKPMGGVGDQSWVDLQRVGLKVYQNSKLSPPSDRAINSAPGHHLERLAGLVEFLMVTPLSSGRITASS
jgi:hypothetical protein